MNVGNAALVLVRDRLAAYDAAAGVGEDAYCANAQAHPMADAKYLLTLTTLHSTQLLTTDQFIAASHAALLRLQQAALPNLGGLCWGLGFPWRELAPTEPYLITSALVTMALCHCARIDPKGNAAAMTEEGVRALEAWGEHWALPPVSPSGVSMLAYSEHIREPIYNVTAVTAGLLMAEGRDPTGIWRARLEWIAAQRIAQLGWKYAPENTVVDLLHQLYILNAFAAGFGARSIESWVIDMYGQFATPTGFGDRLRWHPHTRPEPARTIPCVRPLGEGWLEVLPHPVRLWSLGELLLTIAQLMRNAEHAAAWKSLGQQIATTLVVRLQSADDAESRYPRQSMHALHGLASYLAALRTTL